MFAKLYGDDEDQILVLLQESEEDEDGHEVAFMFQPPSMGLCAVRLKFTPDEEGSEDDAYQAAKHAFDRVDEMMALRAVSNALEEIGFPRGAPDA